MDRPNKITSRLEACASEFETIAAEWDRAAALSKSAAEEAARRNAENPRSAALAG